MRAARNARVAGIHFLSGCTELEAVRALQKHIEEHRCHPELMTSASGFASGMTVDKEYLP
jgi:hypothetical protein